MYRISTYYYRYCSHKSNRRCNLDDRLFTVTIEYQKGQKKNYRVVKVKLYVYGIREGEQREKFWEEGRFR